MDATQTQPHLRSNPSGKRLSDHSGWLISARITNRRRIRFIFRSGGPAIGWRINGRIVLLIGQNWNRIRIGRRHFDIPIISLPNHRERKSSLAVKIGFSHVLQITVSVTLHGSADRKNA